jgi:hypothetical protein
LFLTMTLKSAMKPSLRARPDQSHNNRRRVMGS